MLLIRISKLCFTKLRLAARHPFSGTRSLSSVPSRTGFTDYESERANWNVVIPEKFNFASDVLDVWAKKELTGERKLSNPAFWFVYENGKEIKWSFNDLQTETKKTAFALENHCGLKRGDSVIVMLPKIPEFWLISIASMRTGFVMSPATMMLTSKDLAYRLSALKPSSIIAHESVIDTVDKASESYPNLKTKIVVQNEPKMCNRKDWIDFHSLMKDAQPNHQCALTGSDESMMVFFTSGTTGNPKMAEHTHSSYGIGLADTGKYMLDLTSECIFWNTSDTGWAKTAYGSIFAPWSRGACVFVHQMPRFNPKVALQTLTKYPIDTFCTPPMAYRAMVIEDLKSYKFNRLEHCISGGEALNLEVIRKWQEGTGLRIYEGYGQTETVFLIGMVKFIDYRPGSMGKPAPGMNIAIIDEKGNELPANAHGEIVVKRKEKERIFGLFKGYKNDPALTNERLTDNYYYTGDLGYFDEDGYYYFVGRKDDVINSVGYRIGPFEVENALMEHPAVAEVAVISSPDSERGEEGERTLSIPAFWFVFENGEEVKWSFGDLQRESKKTAFVLENKCGLKRGDNVIVMLPKMPEFWLVNIAAIRIGFVLSPATMQLRPKDLAYRLATLKPSCIVAHESITDVVEQASKHYSNLKTKIVIQNERKKCDRKDWINFGSLMSHAEPNHECADTDSNESMMVFFTSGTTGNPKMVEHSHSSYGICLGECGKYILDLTSNCILWNMSDTGWAKTAYSNIFAPWGRGACVFVHQMARFNPTLALQILTKYPIDTLCAPPMAYRAMVCLDLHSYKFNKLEHCISGGEALNLEVIRKWQSGTGLRIYEAYGQTETVFLVGMYKCLDYKPGSIGKPSPGIDVVIIDENENEVFPNVHGEIAIRRKGNQKIFGLFKGYKDDPELTKSRLTEKYFHTGDLGYYDDEGYFYFVGRQDDIINSAGYRIGPFEVESALMEHPAVAEVAVTSSPDPERGEVVKAFIVLHNTFRSKPHSELIKELQDHTKKITAPYKYPRKVEFLEELPKTASGKIKRFELKNKE